MIEADGFDGHFLSFSLSVYLWACVCMRVDIFI